MGKPFVHSLKGQTLLVSFGLFCVRKRNGFEILKILSGAMDMVVDAANEVSIFSVTGSSVTPSSIKKRKATKRETKQDKTNLKIEMW